MENNSDNKKILREWHVVVDGKWIAVESEENPREYFGHLSQETCLGRGCSMLWNIPKSQRYSRL